MTLRAFGKWNNLEKDKYSYMWNLKKTLYLHREQIGSWQRHGDWVGEKSEGSQKVQTSNYKVNKFWDVMYSIVTIANNTVLYV